MTPLVLTASQKFRVDLARYYNVLENPQSRLARLKMVLGTEAIWAIALYRFGQYLTNEAPAFVRVALKIPFSCAMRCMQWTIGIHLFPSTDVGPGLYIGHYGGIWISPRARIGAHCNIAHEVTIGTADDRGAPSIGDRVWVGPGATISGPITVGSGVVVAANSLVAANVPDNAVVIGVPARIMSYSGSAKLLTPGGASRD
jgi:serine O-acetyltransferase